MEFIWKLRNGVVFNNKEVKVKTLFGTHTSATLLAV